MNLLVVDDDPEMRRYMQRSLERCFPSALVQQAVDGEDALSAAHGRRFDAVVTDVLLPRLDGLALCAALDEALPVLVVSGELEAVERARTRLRGRPGRAFLAKPFNAATLCAAVKHLLGKAVDHPAP